MRNRSDWLLPEMSDPDEGVFSTATMPSMEDTRLA